MKKYLVVLLAALMLFTGCVKVDNTKERDNAEPEISQPQQNDTVQPADDNKNNNDDPYFGQYQMTDEGFSELVKNNAIDRDYANEMAEFQESTEFSTNGWIQLESKYSKLWDNELNNIYKKLLEKLNDEEKKKLLEAQKGWLVFHVSESEFVAEAWEDFGLGSQGRVQILIAERDRIRKRTLQLMEYYHMLGGEVEFLYEGVKE